MSASSPGNRRQQRTIEGRQGGQEKTQADESRFPIIFAFNVLVPISASQSTSLKIRPKPAPTSSQFQ
jgi:hypothetical protein